MHVDDRIETLLDLRCEFTWRFGMGKRGLLLVVDGLDDGLIEPCLARQGRVGRAVPAGSLPY